MDLNLSSDQELLRSTTRTFLERKSSSAELRKLSETEQGFDPQFWMTAVELGWAGLLVPESLGGGSVSGGPLQDVAILAEEAGEFVAPGPLLVTNAVVAGLTYHDNGDQRAAIERIMSGTAVATWAAYEPEAGWTPHATRLVARRVDDGFIMNGRKDRVEAADQADLILVGAMLDGHIRQFLVDARAAGIAINRTWSLDFTRHYGVVDFADVHIPLSALVGSEWDAAGAIERQTQVMLVLQSAETSGATQHAFDLALDWVMNRDAFGRPVASYQAIKHRFADMKTWLEAMHALTAGAVKAVQEGDPDADKLARAAKIFTSVRAGHIIQECVQVHGGIGVTWEHDLHLFLRRVTVNRILYGTPEEYRRELALLIDRKERAA